MLIAFHSEVKVFTAHSQDNDEHTNIDLHLFTYPVWLYYHTTILTPLHIT
jgi:hypothetical protein